MAATVPDQLPILRRWIASLTRSPRTTRKAEKPKRLDVYSLAGGYRTQAGRQAACRARPM